MASVAAGGFAEPAPDNVRVELVGGSVLRGVVVEETEDLLRLDVEGLGIIDLPAATIASRTSPEPAAPALPAEPARTGPDGLFGTFIMEGWEKGLAVGFSGREGNVQELNVHSRFTGEYNDDRKRWRLRAGYFYGLTDGERTKDEATITARRDWLIPESPVFTFVEARGAYDDFQPWEYRVGGFFGIGYAFFDRDELRLLTRAGFGGTRDFGVVNDFRGEALLGIEFQWRPRPNQTVQFINTYFPDLEDSGEFRNVTEASWSIRLDRARGLSLKFGVENEYQSNQAGDANPNDLRYTGALVYDF